MFGGVLVVDGVLFVVECGECVVIVGEFGVGKLFMVRVLFGLILVDVGVVVEWFVIDGRDVVVLFECVWCGFCGVWIGFVF